MASFTAGDSAAPISSRGEAMLAPATPYLGHHFAALANLWCPDKRPDGFVTLAVAENKLSYDLLHARLPPLQSLPWSMAQYADMKGVPSFREALATFMTKHVIKAQGFVVDPAHLCVSAGVGSLLNHLGQALFEEGDAVLIPSPFYASFVFDLKVIAKVQTLAVPLAPPDYRLTREALDGALARYKAEGRRVKGLILTSPQNPLGIIYSEEELRMCIDWAKTNGLHLISDEIYALSVFDRVGKAAGPEEGGRRGPFVSVAQLLGGRLGSHVHVLWGFSKDFGVSGFRVGVLLSQNEPLQQALSSVSYFCAVSNPMQAALTEIVLDDEFIQRYVTENARRLRAAASLCCQAMDELCVSYVAPSAGMFLWIDLSPYLPEPTWEAEYQFFLKMKEQAGLILTPGESQLAPHPGHFRVCYAFASMDALAEGLRRLKLFLSNQSKSDK